MAPTMLTVTGGAHGWTLPDGTLAHGGVTLTPVAEAEGGGWIIAAAPVTFQITAGQIAPPNQIASNTEATNLQFVVQENIAGAKNPPPYVVTPTGTTLDLSSAPRAAVGQATPQYVLASTVGAAGGPAGPLGASGALPPLQAPRLWELAEQFAGLSNPTVITDFQAGMDLNTPITLAAGTYTNKNFVCAELHIPNSNTQLINCRITCGNSARGVRFDEDGGVATRRRLEHCQITAVGTATNGAGYDLLLCEVTGNGDDAARLGRGQVPTTFTLCHFHNFTPPSGAHTDGVQIVTWPAADVTAVGCSIEMAPAPGYTMPGDAGFTGALFFDPTDVAIPVGDPEPNRHGRVWFDQCKLTSTQNYPVVVDQPGVLLTNCGIAKGTTDYVSNPNTSIIAGWNNVDLTTHQPLSGIDVGGYLREPQTLARLQDVDMLTVQPSNGQVPVFDSTSGLWKPGTAAGSTSLAQLGDVNITPNPPTDGSRLVYNAATSRWIPASPVNFSTTTVTFAQRYFTTGDSPTFPNTAGVWTLFLNSGGTAPQYELDIAAVVGDTIEADFGGIRTQTNNTAVDLAVVVGSTIKRFLATGTANATGTASGGTGAGSGDDAWVPLGGTLLSRATSRQFQVTSADLDGANVRLCIVIATTTAAGLIQSNGNNTLNLVARCYHTTSVTF